MENISHINELLIVLEKTKLFRSFDLEYRYECVATFLEEKTKPTNEQNEKTRNCLLAKMKITNV